MRLHCEINDCTLRGADPVDVNNPVARAIGTALIREIDRRVREKLPHRDIYPSVYTDTVTIWIWEQKIIRDEIRDACGWNYTQLGEPIAMPADLSPLLHAYWTCPKVIVPRDDPRGFDSFSGSRLLENFPELCYEIEIPDYVVTGE